MRVLILGGTSEASSLARAIADDPRYQPTLSFAGRTSAPVAPPIPYRVGGFGGIDGLVTYLRAERIDALIDATHPFAEQMTRNAEAAAKLTNTPLLAVCRPPWQPTAGDRWTTVPDMTAAADALGRTPCRVFLTIGQTDLAAFAAAPWHYYVIRSVDPPDPAVLPPQAMVIAARGPFAAEAERQLLQQHGIDIIVTKNSGGIATEGKLIAARTLGLPVVMVARPTPPAVTTVTNASDALDWLARLHGAPRRGV